jgi:hypothetical protein
MRSIGNAIGREDGLEHGAPSRDELAVRVRELAVAEPESMALLEPLLAVPASLLEELARLTKRVLDSVEAEATCRQLLTSPRRGLPAASLPGIGSMAFWPSMHRPDHCADLSGYHRPAGTLGEVA